MTEPTIPLSNIAYAYGYGVYENIRVAKKVPYFLPDHLERLLHSAKVIGLEHQYDKNSLTKQVQKVVDETSEETYNLKILLIGGEKASDAMLHILPLTPFFPDRKLYKDGASVITVEYERLFPGAKTLNMLGSYLAYKKAKAAGCYDALLINKNGDITEGTRTNFFAIKDKTLYSPPTSEILEGIMRKAVLKVALANGFKLEEKKIPLASISQYDGAFLTSTSSQIMPISKINDVELAVPAELSNLMKLFKDFYDTCGGNL
jgi:branched-chain amino acid aminotransferase